MSDRVNSATTDFLHAGHAALARGDWLDARRCFEDALAQETSAEILEGLGMAVWWLNDAGAVFNVREHAYRLYREAGDQRGAGRMAVYIALDYYLFRGEEAVVNGWFQLAHRLLDDLELGPEHAVLPIWEGYVKLMAHNDVDRARELSTLAAEIGQTLGLIDLEMLAQALHGFALVTAGDMDGGMRLLDEATTVAASGDMTDLDAIVTTYCFLIYACERVRDYDRAVQWCSTARQLSVRWNYRFMFSFCQIHYAAVLIWHGEWDEAEAELLAAIRDLESTHPAMAGEGMTRLAELRRRQGRTDEAAELLRQADLHPLRMASGRYALLGRAALALDQDDPETAADLAQRFLRRIHNGDRLEYLAGLEVLVRAEVAKGNHTLASESLHELRSISNEVETASMQASVSYLEGLVAVSARNLNAARQHFEDAIDLFQSSGAPFDTAVARLEFAQVLFELGRHERARIECQSTMEILQDIGAQLEARRAEHLLVRIEAVTSNGSGQRHSAGNLTGREVEVLRLVAQGMTDKELATELDLSEHTIHRHIANILTRLNVPSRAAAVALAVRSGII